MTYAAATDLLSRFDAEEIAQRADRETPRLVTGVMLSTAAAGGSLAVYTVQEQNATTTALAVVNRALADADARIHAYLAGRYELPLTAVTDSIKQMACDMARYYLFDEGATDVVRERYEAATKYFSAVGSGKLSLGIDSTGKAPATNLSVMVSGSDPVFGRSVSKDFI